MHSLNEAPNPIKTTTHINKHVHWNKCVKVKRRTKKETVYNYLKTKTSFNVQVKLIVKRMNNVHNCSVLAIQGHTPTWNKTAPPPPPPLPPILM